jgi:hypothetical protein
MLFFITFDHEKNPLPSAIPANHYEWYGTNEWFANLSKRP